MTGVRERVWAQAGASEEELAVLEARARRLREGSAGAEDEDVAWVAQLELAGERYAVPLEQVRGCTRFRQVTPVPLAPPAVLGITRYEGRVVTVFGLAALLQRPWGGDPTALLVLEPEPGWWVAVDAEGAPVPVAVPAAALAAARALDADGPVAHVAVDGAPLRVLSPARLLRLQGVAR